jgi:hypothetical protein
MFNFHSFKSGTAALVALAITSTTVAPFITTAPALAQRRPAQREQINIVVPSGTSIPVRYDKDKVVVMPDETVPLTLTVARDVKASDGKVLIYEGSEITGDLKPVSGGTQFVAKQLTLYRPRLETQTRPFTISGTSNVVRRTEEITQGASTGSILQGAAIGGAAAAAIAALVGDRAIATEEILGGAGLGAIGGFFLNRKKANVLVVYPDQDLAVKLSSQFALRSSY